MGTDIHVKVAKYNSETNLYEELQLFRKRKPGEKEYKIVEGVAIELPWTDYKEIYIDAGRNYEMMDGMKGGDEKDGYGYFPWTSISFASLESSFAEKIKEKQSTAGYFDFYEITLADMYNYTYTHPTVVDYDSKEWKNENPPKKPNPIIDLLQIIEDFVSLADNDNFYYTPYSYYKIIFYFDN